MLGEVKNWMVIWWQVVSEIFLQKFSKYNNWFSRYSQKCRGCFLRHSVVHTNVGLRDHFDDKSQSTDADGRWISKQICFVNIVDSYQSQLRMRETFEIF